MPFDDVTNSSSGPRLVSLSRDECLVLLASNDLGRIGVVDAQGPSIFPVSYQLLVVDGDPVIAIRTRAGGVIDRRGAAVSFEIDGLDIGHDGGWSVLIRGVLEPIELDNELDQGSLLPQDHDAWRAIVPSEITGRRLLAGPVRWTFDPHGYL
ncbi:MAG: pyridoxamine 5'-phosphate oxidase family protein [Ilumatobacteraceae bacterium]